MKMKNTLVALLSALLLLTGCGNGNQANQTPKLEKKLPIGLQMYGMRDDLAQDFYGTLVKVKEMGYEGVEFSGLHNIDPAQIRQWCDELGLVVVSNHVSVTEMVADIEGSIEMCRKLGCKYICAPWFFEDRRPGGENFARLMNELDTVSMAATEAGFTYLYHNHDFEFDRVEDGRFGLDYIFETHSDSLMKAELDLCWIKYAGQDPIAYLEKYADRTQLVHLKDYYVAEDGTFEFRPLGQGIQDVPALIQKTYETNATWLLVEQDNPTPGKSAMQCSQESMDYLREILK